MIISIISKTEISSLEISRLRDYCDESDGIVIISNRHVVIKTKDVCDVTPDVTYMTFSVKSLSEYMMSIQKEIAA